MAERKAGVVRPSTYHAFRRPYTPSLPDDSSEASVNRDIDSCNPQRLYQLEPHLHQLQRHGDEDGRPPTQNAQIERTSRVYWDYGGGLSWTGSPITYTDTSEMGRPVVRGEEGGRKASSFVVIRI